MLRLGVVLARSLQGSGQRIQWQLEFQNIPSFTVWKESLLSGFVVVCCCCCFIPWPYRLNGGQDNSGCRLLLICPSPFAARCHCWALLSYLRLFLSSQGESVHCCSELTTTGYLAEPADCYICRNWACLWEKYSVSRLATEKKRASASSSLCSIAQHPQGFWTLLETVILSQAISSQNTMTNRARLDENECHCGCSGWFCVNLT